MYVITLTAKRIFNWNGREYLPGDLFTEHLSIWQLWNMIERGDCTGEMTVLPDPTSGQLPSDGGEDTPAVEPEATRVAAKAAKKG